MRRSGRRGDHGEVPGSVIARIDQAFIDLPEVRPGIEPYLRRLAEYGWCEGVPPRRYCGRSLLTSGRRGRPRPASGARTGIRPVLPARVSRTTAPTDRPQPSVPENSSRPIIRVAREQPSSSCQTGVGGVPRPVPLPRPGTICQVCRASIRGSSVRSRGKPRWVLGNFNALFTHRIRIAGDLAEFLPGRRPRVLHRGSMNGPPELHPDRVASWQRIFVALVSSGGPVVRIPPESASRPHLGWEP